MERQDLIELFDGEPDLDYIDHMGSAVAVDLSVEDHGSIRPRISAVNYQPGDGTRYELIFTPLSMMTQHRRQGEGDVCEGMIATGSIFYKFGATLVSIVNAGACYPLALAREPGTLAPSYVAEHWKVPRASAAALILLFEAIAGHLEVPF